MSFKPSFNFGSKNNSNEEDDEYSFGGSSLGPTSQYSHTQHLKQPLVGAQKVSNPYLPPQTGRIGGITNRQTT